MTASRIGYAKVHGWVKEILTSATHATVIGTVAWVVLCLLAAQRLTPAALARALPAEDAGSGRSRLRRIRRWWSGPALDQTTVTPRLISAALALLPPAQGIVIALDTTRVGGWEIWQAGVVFAGHTLPVAWAVVPYPWPKGKFRQVTLALIAQLQAGFGPGQRWVLVADRGFPNPDLFAQLLRHQTDWTVRLRLSDWVEIQGVYAPVADHLDAGRLVAGAAVAATLGTGAPSQPRVTAQLVVSESVPRPPVHKRNLGTTRERAKRAKERTQHLAQKGRKSKPPSARAQRYAHTWVLFTTAPTVDAAVAQYAQRMAIEETFRDWHHGWGLRAAAAALPTVTMVTRLVGLVSVADQLHVALGVRLSRDPRGQIRRAQWTVTDRVSYFWCAQHLFTDAGCDWTAWLADQWEHLGVPPETFVAAWAA
jgi:hypothetical protein